MSKEQIEEMAKDLDSCPYIAEPIGCNKHDGSVKIAEYLYNAGYRRQSEGEWIILPEDDSPWDSVWKCGRCGANTTTEEPVYKNFCPNCGAKMKGGAE